MALPRALPGSDPQDMAGWGSGPWSPETGNFEMGTSELPQTFNILIQKEDKETFGAKSIHARLAVMPRWASCAKEKE